MAHKIDLWSEEEKAAGFLFEDVKFWFRCFTCKGWLYSIPALIAHGVREHQLAPQDVVLPKVLPPGAAEGKVFLVGRGRTAVPNSSASPQVYNIQNSSVEGSEESSRQQEGTGEHLERDKSSDEAGSVGSPSGAASVPDSGMFEGPGSEFQEDEPPQHRTIVPPPAPTRNNKPERTTGQEQRERRFSCDLCHKTYKSKGVLNFHVRKAHISAKSQNSESTKEKLRRDAATENCSNESLPENGSPLQGQEKFRRDAETENCSTESLPENVSSQGQCSPGLSPSKPTSSSSSTESDKESSTTRGKSSKHTVTHSTPKLDRSRKRTDGSATSKASDSDDTIPISTRIPKTRNQSETSKPSDSPDSSPKIKKNRKNRNQPGTSESSDPEYSTPPIRKRRCVKGSQPWTTKSSGSSSEDSTFEKKRLRGRRVSRKSKVSDSEESISVRKGLRRRQRNEPVTVTLDSDPGESSPTRKRSRRKGLRSSRVSDSEDSPPIKKRLRRRQKNKPNTSKYVYSSSCSSSESGSVSTKSSVESDDEEGELSDKSTTSEGDDVSAPDLTDDQKVEEDPGKKKLTAVDFPDSDFEDIFIPITAKSQKKRHRKKEAAKEDENVRSKSPTPEARSTTVCNVCKLECKTPIALVSHMQEAHNKGKPVDLLCGYCQKRFTTNRKFNKHILTHQELQKQ